MEKIKELGNEDLDNVSGGAKNLDDYLKTLVGQDKPLIVDQGTGKSLELKPSITKDDDGNIYVIKREKDISEE